jgi:quercetin dioxygenase-like cupin family protein
MKMLTLVTAVALAATPTLATADTAHVMLTPDAIKWGDAPAILPAGTKIAVLTGDPFKPGLYVLRLKLAANSKIAPHTHPVEEHVTVLSGNFAAGMGDKIGKTSSFPGGSFLTMPAKMAHYVVLKEETIVEISGIGPFALTYVNPADDPSKTAKP